MENTTQKPPEESDELEAPAADAAATAPPAGGAPAAATPAAPAPAPQAGGPNFIKDLIFGKKYLIIFVFLIMAAGGAVMFAVSSAKHTVTPTIKTQSLSSKEIAALKGNTTVVGDPQQILDVQSSAVFEGAVLLRNNLEIAGSLKVSSPLSLSTLNVSGGTTLGQLAANALSLSGTATLQGDVTIQKNLSVTGTSNFSGALSAARINVTDLALGGDLLIPRHVTTNAGIPARTCGPALGEGSCSVSGSDTAGTINMNTGNTTSIGILATVSFAFPFKGNPHISVAPIGINGAELNYYVTNRTATGFTLATTNAPPPNSNFAFDYIIID